MENTSLKPLAQDAAWKALTNYSTPPQSLLFVGPSGVGKKRTARAYFQFLNCTSVAANKPCGECLTCRRIANQQHPDLVEIGPENNIISVDSLKDVKKMLYFAPMESKFRFVIIDEAHCMNHFSANSILKTLEETPAHTRFILITHERGLLIPTILSRCQYVNFKPLPQDVLLSLLNENGIVFPEKLKDFCLDALAGGMARAQSLADPKILEYLTEAHDLVLTKESMAWQNINRFSEKVATQPERIELLLDLIVWNEKNKLKESLTTSADYEKLKHNINKAFEASFLKERLIRNANRKLLALNATVLAKQNT